MSPKTQYPKELIVESAFLIAKDEGIDQITMRKVAKAMGGSVAPIYVNFKDIKELKDAVIKRIFELSYEYYQQFNTGNPFYDIGMASIKFAKEYPIIFRDLVMTYNDHMKHYEEEMGFLLEEMKRDPDLQGLTDDELKQILLKMRVFQLGLSIMAANDLLPDSYTEEKMMELLSSTASDVVYSTLHNKNS